MRMLLPLAIGLLIVATPAQAYVGPGLGLGAIGAFFGAVVAGLLAILGFVWYPIKRVLRTRRARKHPRTLDTAPDEQDI